MCAQEEPCGLPEIAVFFSSLGIKKVDCGVVFLALFCKKEGGNSFEPLIVLRFTCFVVKN